MRGIVLIRLRYFSSKQQRVHFYLLSGAKSDNQTIREGGGAKAKHFRLAEKRRGVNTFRLVEKGVNCLDVINILVLKHDFFGVF